jgi:uncharacterized YccA/Bax inhibitor family protein
MNNDEVGGVLVIALIFFVVGVTMGYLFVYNDATEKRMKEAFERGYAVQCVGIEGYYWECEE